MKEKKEYMDLAFFAVGEAKKGGADAAEAFISDSQSVQINVSNRQPEQVNAFREAGVGLRILKDKKIVFGSTNELSKVSIKGLVSDLMRKVPFHTPDEFNVIPEKERSFLEKDWSSYFDFISYDPQVTEIPIQEKIKKVVAMEEAALNYSPKVSGSMFAVYQDNTIYFYIANSNGISGWFPASGCGGAIEISAAEGNDHQSGSYFKAWVKYADFNPNEIGRRAAENAVKMLGARPIRSSEIPMVIAPDVGTQILSYIASMLSADQVQKGRSLFAAKLETHVAADALSLIDDGKLKGGLSTSPVDGEGIPKQTTPLIVKGVLKNYLYDSYTAKKGKVKSTGNRSRGSFQGPGGIGPTNLFMAAGPTKPQEIFSSIPKGFYMTVAFGLHAGIDSASGDFSIPVAGFMIERGRVTFPVRGISIGGNLFEFLKAVDKIGDDLTWFETVGCPTFSVKSIKIGGAS